MKKRSVYCLLLICLLLFGGAGVMAAEKTKTTESVQNAAESEVQAETEKNLKKPLVILYTNDVHCGIDESWGYAGVYAAKQSFAKDNHVMLVDAGDHLQGAPAGMLTKGSAVIDIMNATGYDLAVPGNHELDYTMTNFLTLTARARFPYLSCNLTKNGKQIFPSYLIKEFDGVKAAFLGICTPESMVSTVPSNLLDEKGDPVYGFCQDMSGEKLYAAVQKAVDEAKKEGADYVIAVAHLGILSSCSPWNCADVIGNTTGIDAMIDGHSHDTDTVALKNKDGEDVLRTSSGTKLTNMGVLTLGTDGTFHADLCSWNVKTGAQKLLDLENPAAKAVSEAEDQVKEQVDQMIGKTTADLVAATRNQEEPDEAFARVDEYPQMNLADLITDAFRIMAPEADISIVNFGGIRYWIAKGDITMNDILKVQPFNNGISVISATGQQILDALEWSVRIQPETRGCLYVSGMTYRFDPWIESPCLRDENSGFAGIDDSKPRRVSDVMVGEQPIDPNAVYKVASYTPLLKEGLSGFTMFQDCEMLYPDFSQDFQTIADYIAKLGGVVAEGYEDPQGQGRITMEQENAGSLADAA